RDRAPRRVQRLALAGPDEAGTAPGDVQRDLAVAVPNQPVAAGGVRPGEGEHAFKAMERVEPPLLERGRQNLGVAGRRELVAERGELRPDLAVVPDLPVETEDRAGPAERLRARVGQVDERQADVAVDGVAGGDDPRSVR